MIRRSTDILADLIAFPTVSRDPNMALIRHVAELLAGFGIDSEIIPDKTGNKANLFATVGAGTNSGKNGDTPEPQDRFGPEKMPETETRTRG